MDTNVERLPLTRASSASNVALAGPLQRGYRQWARDHAVGAPGDVPGGLKTAFPALRG